jgi:ABC-2 type transport system permease protein
MSAAAFFGLLLSVNVRMARRRVAALREQSWLMMGVIVSFMVGYWGASYLLFHFGFGFLTKSIPGIGPILVDRMLYLFFAFLFLMLIFSNMIISYTSLFKSQETQWMLTLPVLPRDVFRWKLVETAVLASWAFLFLSAPLILAYGTSRDANLWFYLKALVLFIPFTVIPAAIGSLAILLVTRYLHRRVFKWALFGLGSVVLVGCALFVKPINAADLQEAQTIGALNQLLHNSRITVLPVLPSYWVASSMIAWGGDGVWKGTFFFLVLLSNAMMATLVCVSASGRLFYDGWTRTHSQGGFRVGVGVLDKSISLPRAALLEPAMRLLPRIDPCTRALVVKDIRVFWRDTSQWSQFVIFFGLLGLYVVNLRNVAYDWHNEFWAAFVSFLNLGAASMTLATLTTRFVFPQFSLEGKRLWIVGMVPDGLRRVLLEKFWLSSFVSIAVTLSLTLVSSFMLHVPAWLTLLFGATVVLMSFSLCGIAVGIGALFPNFGKGSTANRQDDSPAKIVSGFGGTFCFVLSLLYIVLVIGAEALPLFLQMSDGALHRDAQPWTMVAAWLFVSTISLIAITAPMQLALRRVESLEL